MPPTLTDIDGTEIDRASTPHRRGAWTIDRLFQAAFWAAILVTLYFACAPSPPTVISNDKSQHQLAFAVLTLLAAGAFPRIGWPVLLVALAAFGAGIEGLQAIPTLGRDSDLGDWYADVAAVAITLLGVRTLRAFVARRPP